MGNIKISIITITYNSEKTVEETIRSVLNQDYENIEYVIIDGGSTDSTLDIVNNYRDRIACVISEKDKGISDAFNKGIQNATGELIGIINSDDVLLPNALSKVASYYDPLTEVYRGNTIVWNAKTQYKCREIPSMKFPVVPYFIHVSHQGTFITRKAYSKYGLFDLNFRYAMDLELLCRFYRSGSKFKYMDVDVALFRVEGDGVTSDSLSKKKEELKYLVVKNGGSSFQAWLYYANLKCIDCIKKILNIFGEDFKRKLRYRPTNN